MTTTDAAKLREDAERLYDWYLPNGHPDRGIYGINPWRLDDWDIAYIQRDEAIQRLIRHVLATVPEECDTPPRPLQPGDKVLVEAIVERGRNDGVFEVRPVGQYGMQMIAAVPLASIRPFPQEESSQ